MNKALLPMLPEPIMAADSPRFTTLPPLSLYIHIPWCLHKCPYCDFNSHRIAGNSIPEERYLDALMADLEHDLPLIWGRPINTIFIGGGTPSLLSGRGIDRLLSQLRACLRIAPEAEITLETNPGTGDAAKFEAFHTAGINRLSIGVQSFDDDALRRLGRIHNGQQARHAYELARLAGFENINLDLMFALPGQTVANALDDLQTAIDLQPDHISCYQLTIEPHTPFHYEPPSPCDEKNAWQMQEQAKQFLGSHGYVQYEVSAYARDASQCRHNLNYWRFGDYLGIGAGAHSKLTNAQKQTITRLAKVRHPKRYIDRAGSPGCIQSRTSLQPGDIVLEFMMNALRLTAGFEKRLFAAQTGLPPHTLHATLETAIEKGLIGRDRLNIRPTELGRRYLNNLLELFIPTG